MVGLALKNDETKTPQVRQLGQELRCRHKAQDFRCLQGLFFHCTSIYVYFLISFKNKDAIALSVLFM